MYKKEQGLKFVVMVASGDVQTRQSLGNHLKDFPVKILETDSGKECIKKVKEVDIILLDDDLMDGKGHELVSALHQGKPDVKIIFITPEHDLDLEIKVRREGVISYMVKPLDMRGIGSILEKILGLGKH